MSLIVNPDGSLFQPLKGGNRVRQFDEKLEGEWAYQHAFHWAKDVGLSTEEAEDFSEYFREGWLEYLRTETKEEESLKNILRMFRKEKASGD